MKEEKRASAGAATRRAVMGDAYVDRALATTYPLSGDLQELLTDFAWGAVWSRPGLERAQRSLITIALLVALNRPNELRLHVEAAIRNGLTTEQIYEVILHCIVYCGFPAGLDAMKVAREVLSGIS